MRTRLGLIGAIAALAAAGATGCGASGDRAAGGSGSTGASGGGGDGVATATQRLDAAFKGSEASPPTTAPKPPAGKTVWIISCGQSSESCQRPSGAAEQAAERLGWKATVFDAKFDPSLAGAGVRQAIAAKADGIVSVGWDCPVIRGPLEQAKARGVQVVPSIALDCSEPAFNGGASLMTNVTLVKQYDTLTAYLRAWGAARADWAITRTRGRAKVILFGLKDLVEAQEIVKGFKDELKICSGCEVVDEPSFQGTDTGAGLQGKAAQSLVRHPEANVVIVDYNSTLVGGVQAAITQSGRRGKLLIGGGEGMSSDFQLLSDGKIDAIFYANQDWNGWAAIDTLSRLLAGEAAPEAQVPQGNGFAVIDKEHNFPAAPPSSTSSPAPILHVEWQPVYEKAWGLG